MKQYTVSITALIEVPGEFETNESYNGQLTKFIDPTGEFEFKPFIGLEKRDRNDNFEDLSEGDFHKYNIELLDYVETEIIQESE